jgi:hypothetical protein
VNSDVGLVCRRMVTSAEPIRLQVHFRPICTVCFVFIVMYLAFLSCPFELIVRRELYRDNAEDNSAHRMQDFYMEPAYSQFCTVRTT